MSYKPPYARMRQIQASASPPIPKTPQNVEEALLDLVLPEVIEPEVIEPEEVLLTSSLPVDVEEAVVEEAVVEEAVVEEAVVEEAEEAEDLPEYSLDLSRKDLKVLADKYGVEVKGSKADIVAALDEHFGK